MKEPATMLWAGGNRHCTIYKDKEDYATFLNLVASVKVRYPFTLHAYYPSLTIIYGGKTRKLRFRCRKASKQSLANGGNGGNLQSRRTKPGKLGIFDGGNRGNPNPAVKS